MKDSVQQAQSVRPTVAHTQVSLFLRFAVLEFVKCGADPRVTEAPLGRVARFASAQLVTHGTKLLFFALCVFFFF